MNRTDFQSLSQIRQREARALQTSGHSPGAYYLMGYAVECALKACVAKQTRRHDFPDRAFAQQAHVHDLEKLMKLAGLDRDFRAAMQANPELQLNWAVAKDWKETSRYDRSISQVEAKDLISACTARKNGVLPWIRARW